jgi:hypothetical protein
MMIDMGRRKMNSYITAIGILAVLAPAGPGCGGSVGTDGGGDEGGDLGPEDVAPDEGEVPPDRVEIAPDRPDELADPPLDPAEDIPLEDIPVEDIPADDAAADEENRPPACICDPAPMTVEPLDTITLSAAGCTDPDGDPLTYAWTVVSRPPGSTAEIVGPDSREAHFFVDLATTTDHPYVFSVTVTDPSGASATCEVTVLAVPAEALHIQLVWDRDGTDLDLHLLNPAGSADPDGSVGWFNTPNDCHWGNRSPNWGDAGSLEDNPSLDIDDVDGFGPENISLDAPAAGTYTVGAHYYCDHGLGPSLATVRIYCGGVLAAELAGVEISSTGQLWQAATIQWPGCVVTELGDILTVGRGCSP